MMWTENILFLILCVSFVRCQSVCHSLATCGECIGSGSEDRCVWCSQPQLNDNGTQRCQPESYMNVKGKTWCDMKHILNPPLVYEIVENKDFGNTTNKTIIQFKPQRMKIKIRPGVPVPITMAYKPAEHFPLDVYYLMDNSYTMITHKEALKSQAYQIFEELTALTNNVQLGVGSFVEKPGFPYFDKNKQSGCHAFLNILSLTKNTDKFKSEINNIKIGANYDDMEAGLDALMQAMTCEDQIGWRNESRRIIVLCTDSPYHSAGDGKMLGIIKPNDMKCHMKNQMYELEMEQDYPSVSQINEIATRKKFTIIFAATANAREVYTALAKEIMGASYAELKPKSNIVDIIKIAYTDSVQSVKLDSETPPHVQLKIDQNCESKPKHNCASTYSQPIVQIPATITVRYCPPGNKKSTFSIRVVGLNDKLDVELEVVCKCHCENENILSSKCNDAGFMQCGVCNCIDTRYGDKCQCNVTSEEDKRRDVEKCKKNADDINACTGRGQCLCGKCNCVDGYSGTYCEYDNKLCLSPGDKLCSHHGSCYLGSCHCDKEWIGDDCACPNHDRGCIAPYSSEICSGNGKCDCGKCKCNQIEGKNETYTGVFCDMCDDCQAKYCKDLEDYVFCNYENTKDHCDGIFNDTKSFEVEIVNKTEMNSDKWRRAAWCKKELEDGSFIIFRYYHDPDTHTLRIRIQREPEKPPIANKWIALGSAILAIVLIGLLTLIIWKILVDMHDKREYAKFEEESKSRGFDVSLNPLYEEPAINFSNPIYNRNIQ